MRFAPADGMLRHRAASKPFVALVALATIAVSACETRDVPQGPSPAASVATTATAAAPPTLSPRPPLPVEPPPACATLRDVAVSDVVRIDGTTLLYADAGAGLTIVDVSDVLRPRQIATIPFTGTPTALFVRDGIAWVVFIDPDSRFLPGKVATVVRAVDVRLPEQPRMIGEIAREGHARDAKLVGGVLYVMRATAAGRTTLESFGLRNEALRALDNVNVAGTAAQLAASSAGLALVTVEEDHSNVAWLDLPLESPGSVLLRATVRLPGGVATWVHGDGRLVSADDGQRVRLVTCATRSCGPADAATLRVVDFGTRTSPQIGPSLRVTERGGLPLTRFADELLFVAETSPKTRGATALHVVETEDRGPRFVSHVQLRGLLSALVPHDGSLVALGTIETPESTARIVIHDVDIRRPAAPRVRSSVSFGSDWTWSAALDDDDAVSFDPGSHLMAIPFTAWRQADQRYVAGTQVVDLDPYGARTIATVASDAYVERAVFIDGHLLSIGPSGVIGIDYSSRSHDTELGSAPELSGFSAPFGSRTVSDER